MASQQILFAETVAGMKKAFKRKAYESDSDSDIENYGNRGNKLKKRARFARQGQLAPTQGPSAYKESVQFAGAPRAILHRNPPLVDEEGYEIDSEDDDERVEDAALAAAELNPYAHIRLEHLLAPLTASTDLPTHSTLSKPFVSKTLTNLVSQSSQLMRRENQSLWRMRQLWTSLCGDGTWMPCGLMVGSDDISLYKEDHVAQHLLSLARANGADASPPTALNGDVRREGPGGASDAGNRNGDSSRRPEEVRRAAEVLMMDVGAFSNGTGKSKQKEAARPQGPNGERPLDVRQGDGRGPYDGPSAGGADEVMDAKKSGLRAERRQEDAMMRDAAEPTAHARADPRRTASSAASEASEQNFIHPLFLTPAGARPDRNMGLPEHEAEDIRRLLGLYVQKQEEICRGATRLHHGLLRAERLRKDVLHWAKAEAHCGPNRDMSDGEDWYDKEEWGLTEDLKKGQDEEEEDTTTTGKKTRNRR
ncbi:hypothetical protein CDD83_8754 [Cordyceps sp. RAO-2017]|nr:hypothetical protein CDD83_8754 [Cordyceps sp. RAO-2017]